MKKYGPLFVRKPILEAVVHPEEYLKNIGKKINKFKKIFTKFSNLEKLCIKLNIFFYFNRIQFRPIYNKIKNKEEFTHYGIDNSEILSDKYTTIVVYLNNEVLNIFIDNNFYDNFLKWLLFSIKHELIHRGQVLQVKDTALRAKVFKQPEDKIKYLSHKQEIMTRAWEIVELLKLKNYNNNNILNLLSSNNEQTKRERSHIVVLDEYQNIFKKDSWQLKLLYKYMYEYLKDDETIKI